MAAHASVPQFGKWDNEDNVPYTVYFDNARKGRGGKMINPNDPQENPDMFRQFAPPAPAPVPVPVPVPALVPPAPFRRRHQTVEPVGRGAVRRPHEHHGRREDGNFRQFVDSPAHTDNMGHRTVSEPPQHHYGHGSHSSRPTRQSRSAGSEHSVERSPIHPHHQAKVLGRGGTSPAWDGKSSFDSGHGTAHGKSRMKPVARVDESPDRGAAVPRFGDWDENNPQSAENYTHIFNIVREERHSTPSNLPGNKFESSYHMTQKQNGSGNRKGCCFPWLGK